MAKKKKKAKKKSLGKTSKGPSVPYNVYLFKTGIDFDDAVDSKKSPRKYQLSLGGTEGFIYVGENKESTPPWVELVSPLVNGQLNRLVNKSTSAAIVVRANRRLLAFVFGYGRYLLNSDNFEYNFGLKVVLNLVNHEDIRSIDSKKFHESFLLSRQQANKATNIKGFGIDIESDGLQAIAGRTRQNNLTTFMAGRDNVYFTSKRPLTDLESIASELVTHFRSDDYKEHFDWVDYVAQEKKPDTLATLNQKLVDALNEEKKLVIAPPVPLDWAVGIYFKYSFRSGWEFDDLDIDEYYKKYSEKDATYDQLKSIKVSAYSRATNQLIQKWSLLQCICFETVISRIKYVLSGGIWFCVDSAFEKRVSNYVNQIKRLPINWPDAKKYQATINGKSETGMEYEEDYIKRAVSTSTNLCIMDQELIKLNKDSIEFCDIFSKQKQMIHLKHRSSSSTLSHLFQQGQVSAEYFCDADDTFRKAVRQKMNDLGNTQFASKIAIRGFRPADYEVVFGFIDSMAQADFPRSLPFFSMVALRNTHRYLKLMRLNVSVARIGVTPMSVSEAAFFNALPKRKKTTKAPKKAKKKSKKKVKKKVTKRRS